MNTKLKDYLTGVHVLDPVQTGPLQVFGLRREFPGGPDYATLDESLASGLLEVTETSQAGSVPNLLVTNKSDRLVLLLSGELLVGAKQNRVLNTSLLVPANSRLVVPVSCVERGRWHYNASTFTESGSRSHPKLRREVSAQAHERYRSEGRPGSDQGAVWREVDRKLHALGSSSRSAALQQAFEDRRRQLDAAVRDVRLPTACNGAAFAFGNRVVGIELFDKPATLAVALAKQVRAYALDAIEDAANDRDSNASQAVSPEAVLNLLRLAADTESQTFKSPGAGEDVRFKSDQLLGASLVVDDLPVHTEVFAVLNGQ